MYWVETQGQCCYSCFNAFSRVDVRVDVKIPGGVHAYVVDLRGDRYVVATLVAVRSLNHWTVASDMKRHPKFGKRHTFLLFFDQSFIAMIRRTG